MAIVLPALYAQSLAGNMTTYRNNAMFLQSRLAGDSPRLFDIFVLLPEYDIQTNKNIFYFVDASSGTACLLMIIALVLRRDPFRWAEVFFVESIMSVTKGAFMVLTNLPDADGRQDACRDPSLASMGWWIVKRASMQFCGDMLYSGHTYHLVLGLIVTLRLFKDWDREGRYKKLIRVLEAVCVVWALVVVLAIAVIRMHYTVDLVLGLFLSILFLSHRALLTVGVKLLYRPNGPLGDPEALTRAANIRPPLLVIGPHCAETHYEIDDFPFFHNSSQLTTKRK